jgi:hypothetical protein
MLIWNKEELPHQWKESVVPIQKRAINLTVVIIEAYPCCQCHTFYPPSFSKLILYAEEIFEITNVDFNVIGQ